MLLWGAVALWRELQKPRLTTGSWGRHSKSKSCCGLNFGLSLVFFFLCLFLVFLSSCCLRLYIFLLCQDKCILLWKNLCFLQSWKLQRTFFLLLAELWFLCMSSEEEKLVIYESQKIVCNWSLQTCFFIFKEQIFSSWVKAGKQGTGCSLKWFCTALYY